MKVTSGIIVANVSVCVSGGGGGEGGGGACVGDEVGCGVCVVGWIVDGSVVADGSGDADGSMVPMEVDGCGTTVVSFTTVSVVGVSAGESVLPAGATVVVGGDSVVGGAAVVVDGATVVETGGAEVAGGVASSVKVRECRDLLSVRVGVTVSTATCSRTELLKVVVNEKDGEAVGESSWHW